MKVSSNNNSPVSRSKDKNKQKVNKVFKTADMLYKLPANQDQEPEVV